MFHSIYWGTNVRKLPCVTTVEDKMTKGPQLVQLKYFIPLLGVWRCGIVRIGGAIVPAPGPVSGDIMEGQNHVISQGRSSYRAFHIQSLYSCEKSTTFDFCQTNPSAFLKNLCSHFIFQHRLPMRNCHTEQMQEGDGIIYS